jgi:hypothetical protein
MADGIYNGDIYLSRQNPSHCFEYINSTGPDIMLKDLLYGTPLSVTRQEFHQNYISKKEFNIRQRERKHVTTLVDHVNLLTSNEDYTSDEIDKWTAKLQTIGYNFCHTYLEDHEFLILSEAAKQIGRFLWREKAHYIQSPTNDTTSHGRYIFNLRVIQSFYYYLSIHFTCLTKQDYLP